jgi:hypothetical protein
MDSAGIDQRDGLSNESSIPRPPPGSALLKILHPSVRFATDGYFRKSLRDEDAGVRFLRCDPRVSFGDDGDSRQSLWDEDAGRRFLRCDAWLRCATC